MLTLTEAAGAYLSRILDDRECPEGVAVRFAYRDTEVSVSLDNEKPGDSKIEHQGRTVLLMDQNTADLLDGQTVDCEQTDTGETLFLRTGGQGPA